MPVSTNRRLTFALLKVIKVIKVTWWNIIYEKTETVPTSPHLRLSFVYASVHISSPFTVSNAVNGKSGKIGVAVNVLIINLTYFYFFHQYF